MEYMQLNEFQTPFEELHLDEQPDEVQEQFWDFINNVPFIKGLISKDRPKAKDLPRDSQGRIIVDISRPHILENMEYFTETADFYKKNGKFTNYRPNPNPNSPYMQWFKREIYRCWYGCVRPEDGEWIPGNMYFYLNFYQIQLLKKKKDAKGQSKKSNRVVDFPRVWEGVYWRYHYIEQAQNGGLFNNWEGGEGGCEISSRGKSKSYSMAAILVKYFTMGESEEVKEAVKALVVAAQKEYLTADGILNKYQFGCDFLIQRPELQLPKQRIKNSLTDMEWKSGYTDLNTKTEVGTLNETFGVTTKDNVGKVRGKRMQFIAVEEFGSFPNVLEMYNIMKLSWIEGDEAFGFIYLIGTSGEKESDFAGAAEIVYNPKGYRMYALPNVWDKEGLGKKEITFFFPGYINYAGCYNDNGTSDVTKALLRILIDRYNVKYNSTDINTITRTIAEVPITPQEALLRVKSNFFPTAQLNERINQLDANPSIYDDIYTGTLVFDANNEVIFQPTNAVPIRNFPHDVNNKEEGTLEIFSLPQKNSNGKVVENRYIAGIDPYDQDNSETMSLYSMFVLDLFTDRIVAEYTGRPKFADEAYELTRKLLLFYNAKGCYENNLKGLYAYFKTMKCTHLLCDTPEYLKGKEQWKLGNYGNLTKGIRATAPINNYANQLIRDWLLQPVVVERKNAQGDNSNLEETNEVTIPLLYTIRNRALLKELALYNPIINVDRIRALGMLMLYREEKIILYNGDLSNIGDQEEIDKDYLGNDEYFSKNYDNKFGNKEVIKFLQRN